jgi:ketosteroid isomerase-like protein
MSETYPFATEPADIAAALVARFNSGRADVMLEMYDREAVFISGDGRTVTDQADIAAELEAFLNLGLPMDATARHVFVAGDIAQVVLDWSLDGTGPDGTHLHLEGTACDIARRGTDGIWRYLIDNPLGTAVRQTR